MATHPSRKKGAKMMTMTIINAIVSPREGVGRSSSISAVGGCSFIGYITLCIDSCIHTEQSEPET